METMKDPALEPARAALTGALSSAASGRERLDLILSAPNAEALVPCLPVQQLFQTVKEVGLSDSLELIHLTSPEQFQSFLDLDAWRRDRLELSAMLKWMRAARLDDDEARYDAKVRQLDLELLELALLETTRIYDLREVEDPETTGALFRSPEGTYLVEFLVEGADYLAVRSLLDDLYRREPLEAARLLEAVRWELRSEVEEEALRWRSARMGDLGFPDQDEALSLFAVASRRAPLPLHPSFGKCAGSETLAVAPRREGSAFDRAAARVPAEAREVLEQRLITLFNTALIAEGLDPGELEQVHDCIAAVKGTLSIALEQLSRGDDDVAGSALAAIAPKELFRDGLWLCTELGRRARRVLKSGVELDDPLLTHNLELLTARWPIFGETSRHFASLDELARAERELSRAEALLADGGRSE